MNQEASEKTRGQEKDCGCGEENGVYVLDVYVAPPDHQEKRKDFHRQGIR